MLESCITLQLDSLRRLSSSSMLSNIECVESRREFVDTVKDGWDRRIWNEEYS